PTPKPSTTSNITNLTSRFFRLFLFLAVSALNVGSLPSLTEHSHQRPRPSFRVHRYKRHNNTFPRPRLRRADSSRLPPRPESLHFLVPRRFPRYKGIVCWPHPGISADYSGCPR